MKINISYAFIIVVNLRNRFSCVTIIALTYHNIRLISLPSRSFACSHSQYRKKKNESAVPTWQIFLFPRSIKNIQGCWQMSWKKEICETLHKYNFFFSVKQTGEKQHSIPLCSCDKKRYTLGKQHQHVSLKLRIWKWQHCKLSCITN